MTRRHHMQVPALVRAAGEATMQLAVAIGSFPMAWEVRHGEEDHWEVRLWWESLSSRVWGHTERGNPLTSHPNRYIPDRVSVRVGKGDWRQVYPVVSLPVIWSD